VIVRELVEAARARAPKVEVAEAVSVSGAIDPDEHLWRSLTRQETRDLPKITHDRSVEVAFTLYQQNPLGHRITELNRDFIVGDGITYTCRNPEVETAVEEFWNDSVNDLDRRIPDFANEFGLYGELCLPVEVGATAGFVRLGYIDPAQIADVLHEKGNPLVLDVVKKRRRLGGSTTEKLDIIRVRSETEGGHLEGDVFFFKTNSVSNSTRGWPDLLHIADWLDAYDALLWEMLERARLVRTFIWDVVLKGYSDAQISEWMRKYGTPPRSGTVRAHNDGETWEAVAPALGSFETAKEAEVLLEHIAGGAGFPKTWLSSAEDVNRAAALEMGTPTVRRLGQRQRQFVALLQGIIRFVLEQAVEAGRIQTEADGLVPAYDEDGEPTEELHKPWELVQIHAPEISPRDVTQAGTLFVNATNALAVASTEGWIGEKTAQDVIAVVLAMLGYEYDPSAGPTDQQDQENAPAPKSSDLETEQEPPSRKDMEEAVRRLTSRIPA